LACKAVFAWLEKPFCIRLFFVILYKLINQPAAFAGAAHSLGRHTMKAVITVMGTDKVGILAKISTICAQQGVNIDEVTQNILGGTFAMIMLVTLPGGGIGFSDISALLRQGGEELDMQVTITRQDTFDAMHRI